MRYTAAEMAWRQLEARERYEAARHAAWAKRSWLSKVLWILFN